MHLAPLHPALSRYYGYLFDSGFAFKLCGKRLLVTALEEHTACSAHIEQAINLKKKRDCMIRTQGLLQVSFTLFFAGLLAGCSGSSQPAASNTGNNASSGGSQSVVNLAGSWQFTAASTKQSGYNTLTEVNLQQAGSDLSASGSNQVLIVAENPSGPAILGGNCPGTGNDVLTGTVSGSNVQITLNERGNLFTITATADSSGKNLTGTYQGTSSGCADSVTFTGALVSPVSGSYAGQLAFAGGTSDEIEATFIPGSGNTLSANIQVAGTDNGSFVMNGISIGNGLSLSGTFQGQTVAYYGFYDAASSSIQAYDPVSGQYIGSLQAGTKP